MRQRPSTRTDISPVHDRSGGLASSLKRGIRGGKGEEDRGLHYDQFAVKPMVGASIFNHLPSASRLWLSVPGPVLLYRPKIMFAEG